MKGNKKPKYFLYGPLMAVLAVVVGAAFFVDNQYGNTMRSALSKTIIDEELQVEATEEAKDINVELVEEGCVLLKNDGILPMKDVSKINLFGVKAVDLSYNASGSAAGTTTDATTLKTGLEESGFTVNPDLYSLIEKNSTTSDTDVHEGGESEAVPELALSKYTGNCSMENLKSYSEYAVVVIGRLAGEGGDISKTGFGSDGTDHYLALSTNEKALLKELKDQGFKTVVLINSSYPMELGVLDQDTYGINGCLWIGGPGAAGTPGVGHILNGSVNPSGRLVDTWAYDERTGSTFYTTMKSNYVYDKNGTMTDAGGYTQYNEGIYYGYRWYETADAVGYWDRGAYSGYDNVVQFPFGYGLSYSSYSYEYAETPSFDAETNEVTFKVKVTNTGAVAGKEVVQIYCESPYTEGGLEKSKVVLAAFGKTSKLDAGANETIELSINMDDIASYDANADEGKGAYVLESGAYKFYLSENAHSWKNIDTKYVYEKDVANDVVYSGENHRASDKKAATNQLTKGNFGNALALDNGVDQLSRAGGFANSAVLQPSYTEVTLNGSTTRAKVIAEGSDEYTALVTNQKKNPTKYYGSSTDTTYGKKKGIEFSDMFDVDYDDPQWETFVSQLSMDDMVNLIGTGGWGNAEITSINKPAMSDIDGPFGLSNYIKTSMGDNSNHCMSYCTECVTAATFNLELIEKLGKTIGKEANASNTGGWYAPGANTHRTPFGGRNAEYFSEDPLLGGKACAAEVKGVQSLGVYVYVKHFAFNDIEANRGNKESCLMTEQTAREIYLKPFELAIKEANATGLMASYMWINGNWVGASYALCTEIARNEWGMQGSIVTDNFCGGWMTATKAVFGGTDLMLSVGAKEVDATIRQTNDGILAMKDACKHILYAIASVQNNRIVSLQSISNPWPAIRNTLVIVGCSGFAVCVGLLVFEIIRYKKAGKKEIVVEETKE